MRDWIQYKNECDPEKSNMRFFKQGDNGIKEYNIILCKGKAILKEEFRRRPTQ